MCVRVSLREQIGFVIESLELSHRGQFPGHSTGWFRLHWVIRPGDQSYKLRNNAVITTSPVSNFCSLPTDSSDNSLYYFLQTLPPSLVLIRVSTGDQPMYIFIFSSFTLCKRLLIPITSHLSVKDTNSATINFSSLSIFEINSSDGCLYFYILFPP